VKHWLTSRMGIATQPCTWCGEPVYDDGRVRNAQDGERHGCTYADALAASRSRPPRPIPNYGRELIEETLLEEWYSSDMESELPESADEEWTVTVEVERP
jgi:hypothetical protein